MTFSLHHFFNDYWKIQSWKICLKCCFCCWWKIKRLSSYHCFNNKFVEKFLWKISHSRIMMMMTTTIMMVTMTIEFKLSISKFTFYFAHRNSHWIITMVIIVFFFWLFSHQQILIVNDSRIRYRWLILFSNLIDWIE